VSWDARQCLYPLGYTETTELELHFECLSGKVLRMSAGSFANSALADQRSTFSLSLGLDGEA